MMPIITTVVIFFSVDQQEKDPERKSKSLWIENFRETGSALKESNKVKNLIYHEIAATFNAMTSQELQNFKGVY